MDLFVPRCEKSIGVTILKPIFGPDKDQVVSIETNQSIFGPNSGKVFERAERASPQFAIGNFGPKGVKCLNISGPNKGVILSPKKGKVELISGPRVGKVAFVSGPKVGEDEFVSGPKVDKGELISSPKVGKRELILSPKVGKVEFVSSPKVGKGELILSPKVGKVDFVLSPKVGEVHKKVTVLSMAPGGKVLEKLQNFSSIQRKTKFLSPIINCRSLKVDRKFLKAKRLLEPRPLDLNPGRVMVKTRDHISTNISSVRVLGNLKVPAMKVAPKRVVPKMWSEAPQSKKLRSIKCSLSKDPFFLQEGSGGFTQAQRDLYEARKKFTAVAVFQGLNKIQSGSSVKTSVKFCL
jgi:hypothetical protein